MTQAEAGTAQTHAALALVWAAAAAAACGWMVPLEPSLLEEGYIVHFAQRMLAGEHLYRDLVTFTGPLPFALLRGLFAVFGSEIAVGRVAVALLQGVVAAAVFDLARRAGARGFAHVAAAAIAASPVLGFPLLHIWFYSVLALQLSLVAAWTAARAPGSDRAALATGVALAAVATCKQTTGLALACTLVVVIALASAPEVRGRRVLRVVASGGATAVACLLAYALAGDLSAFYRGMVTLPLSLESSFTSPYPNLLPPGRFAPEILANQAYYMPHVQHLFGAGAAELGPWATFAIQLLYALPFAALLAVGVQAARRRLGVEAAALAGVVLASTLGLFPRSDWGHLVYVLPASVATLCLFAGRAANRRAVGVAAAVCGAVIVGSTVLVGQALHRVSGPATFGPRVPQRPVSAIYRGPGLPRVIDFLRARIAPGEPIFVARMEPLLYFATGASNPTPYGGVIPGIKAEQERAIARALERVRFVVMSDLDRPVFTWYRDELPGVQALLERHFRLAPAFAGPRASWIGVLERGPDRGEAIVDLFERADSGERYVVAPDGSEVPAPGPPPKLATRQNRRPLAVALGPRGGGIDFRVTLPERAALQLDLGLRGLESEAGPVAHADRVRMRVAIALPGSQAFSTVSSTPVDYRRARGQGWSPLEVDLAAWSGRPVVLRLEALPDAAGQHGEIAWWGSPRVVSRAAGDD